MLELIAGAAVALAAIALVVEPLFKPPVARPIEDDLEVVPLEESESPRIQALLALKEIEFDKATGKLSDEDYERLKAKYSKQALEAMEKEKTEVQGEAADMAEALIQQAKKRARTCAKCGPRPESDAIFCSDCGRPLAASA